MTAEISAKKPAKSTTFYKFLPYYLNKLKFLKPQIIMNCIFAFFSYPFAFTMLFGYMSAHNNYLNLFEQYQNRSDPALVAAGQSENVWASLATMGAIIGCICLLGLFIFTFVTTLRSFRYIYDKNAVDMDYSLPVNHNTRFFADLAAVFSASIVPHLLAVLIGLPLLEGIFSFVSEESWVVVAPFRSVIVQSMFTGLFICIMQIAFCLLTISVSGKKSVASVYPVLLNIAIPLIHALCIAIIKTNTYGAYFNWSWGEMVPISATSPIGMLIMTLSGLFTVTFYSDTNLLSSSYDMPLFSGYGIIAVIITIAFLAGAYFLLKYRRTERVGTAYTFKGMSIVIPGVVILAMGLPLFNMVFSVGKRDYLTGYSYSSNILGWLIGTLISTFIVYVILDLINGGAFRKFHLTLAKWAGTVAGIAGITAVLCFGNGFGAAYYVPSAEDVVSVDYYLSSGYDVYNYGVTAIDVTDKDAINAVIEIHNFIPKTKPDVTPNNTLTIDYTLKNGEVLQRSYNISKADFKKAANIVATPDIWYKSQIEPQLSKLKADKLTYMDVNYGEYTINARSISVNDLADALKKDCEKINTAMLENNFNNSGNVVLRIYDDSGNCALIDVYDFMENTTNLLKQQFANQQLTNTQDTYAY